MTVGFMLRLYSVCWPREGMLIFRNIRKRGASLLGYDVHLDSFVCQRDLKIPFSATSRCILQPALLCSRKGSIEKYTCNLLP